MRKRIASTGSGGGTGACFSSGYRETSASLFVAPAVFLRQIGVDPFVAGRSRIAAVESAEVSLKRRGNSFLLFAKLPASLAPVREFLLNRHVFYRLVNPLRSTAFHFDAIKGFAFRLHRAFPTNCECRGHGIFKLDFCKLG